MMAIGFKIIKTHTYRDCKTWGYDCFAVNEFRLNEMIMQALSRRG